MCRGCKPTRSAGLRELEQKLGGGIGRALALARMASHLEIAFEPARVSAQIGHGPEIGMPRRWIHRKSWRAWKRWAHGRQQLFEFRQIGDGEVGRVMVSMKPRHVAGGEEISYCNMPPFVPSIRRPGRMRLEGRSAAVL